MTEGYQYLALNYKLPEAVSCVCVGGVAICGVVSVPTQGSVVLHLINSECIMFLQFRNCYYC
jgi:hypothetical protein